MLLQRLKKKISVVLYEVHKACISVIIAACEFQVKRKDGSFINFLYINCL